MRGSRPGLSYITGGEHTSRRRFLPRPLGPLLCSGGIASFCHPCEREDPVSVIFMNAGKSKHPGSPIRVGDDRQKQRKRPWIHKYTGSPITNVGDKLAGMTEGERVSPGPVLHYRRGTYLKAPFSPSPYLPPSSVVAASNAAFRCPLSWRYFLGGLSGGMRHVPGFDPGCRPYDCTTTLDFSLTGSPIGVGDDRQKQRERHWIHKYTGSPITNVGDKLAGMTEGEQE